MTSSDQAWRTVQSGLPPDLVPVAIRSTGGTPAEFAAASGDYQAHAIQGGLSGAVGFVLQRYNRAAYEEATGSPGWAPIAPGVLVLPSPRLEAPLTAPPLKGNLRARSLAWILVAVVMVLFVAGSGWSVALLPSDPVLRVALAPGLGGAVLTLIALAWDRVGLGFSRPSAFALVALSSLSGWAASLWTLRSRPRADPKTEGPRKQTAPL
jgi:hypothetical protein